MREKNGSFCHDMEDACLMSEADCARVFISEDNLDGYIEYYNEAKKRGLDTAGFALAIADCYLDMGKRELAEDYYRRVFLPGFDLSRFGYAESLLSYLELISSSKKDLLRTLIESSPKAEKYYSDLPKTYLMLIAELEGAKEEYIGFTDRGIELTRSIVSRDYESGESDTARILCELLSIKLEYYINRGKTDIAERVKAELLSVIGDYGCYSYHTAIAVIESRASDV